jgi:hypothetical protein
MDELINLVTQKAGINTDQARTAVETVINHLKTVLPAPLGSQLDSFLSGAISGQGGGLDGALGSIEGMLGGRTPGTNG